jgi:hypothetical protein
MDLDQILLIFLVHPTRLFIAINLHLTSLFLKDSDILNIELKNQKDIYMLFKCFHPLFGFILRLLTLFEDINSYINFVIHSIGIF